MENNGNNNSKGSSLPVGFLMFVVALVVLKLFFVDAYNIPSRSMEPTLIKGDFILTNKLVYELTDPRRGDIAVFIFPHPEMFGRKLVTLPVLRDFLNITFIKRIIGKPGDVISFNNGRLTINGKPLKYEFVKQTQNATILYEYVPREGRPPVKHLVRYMKNPPLKAEIGRWGVNPDAIPSSACLKKKVVCLSGAFGRMYCAELCTEIKVPRGYYFVMGDNRDDSEDSRYWGFVKRDFILSTPFVIFFSGEVPPVSPRESNPLIGLIQLMHAVLHPNWDRIGKPLIY